MPSPGSSDRCLGQGALDVGSHAAENWIAIAPNDGGRALERSDEVKAALQRRNARMTLGVGHHARKRKRCAVALPASQWITIRTGSVSANAALVSLCEIQVDLRKAESAKDEVANDGCSGEAMKGGRFEAGLGRSNDRIEYDETVYSFRAIGEGAKAHWAAPILADEDEVAKVEAIDELAQPGAVILQGMFTIVDAIGEAEAEDVWKHDAQRRITERAHDLAIEKSPRGISVKHEDRASTRVARFHDMHAVLADLDLVSSKAG